MQPVPESGRERGGAWGRGRLHPASHGSGHGRSRPDPQAALCAGVPRGAYLPHTAEVQGLMLMVHATGSKQTSAQQGTTVDVICS